MYNGTEKLNMLNVIKRIKQANNRKVKNRENSI